MVAYENMMGKAQCKNEFFGGMEDPEMTVDKEKFSDFFLDDRHDVSSYVDLCISFIYLFIH